MDEKKLVKEVMVELYLISKNGEGTAVVMATDQEHAIAVYREMHLGQKIEGTLAAERAMTAPFEAFMRTALVGIFTQQFQAKMAMLAQRR